MFVSINLREDKVYQGHKEIWHKITSFCQNGFFVDYSKPDMEEDRHVWTPKSGIKSLSWLRLNLINSQKIHFGVVSLFSLGLRTRNYISSCVSIHTDIKITWFHAQPWVLIIHNIEKFELACKSMSLKIRHWLPPTLQNLPHFHPSCKTVNILDLFFIIICPFRKSKIDFKTMHSVLFLWKYVVFFLFCPRHLH